MFANTPTTSRQALEKRFVSTWWADTIAVLRKANEDKGLPVHLDDGRAFLKSQLIAVRGLHEMEFDWDEMTTLFEMASALADMDMASMAAYLGQLVGVGKASYKTRGDYMTHIFEHVKSCKDLGTLPAVKNKKGETIRLDLSAKDDQAAVDSGAGAQAPVDDMSVDGESPIRGPAARSDHNGSSSNAATPQSVDAKAVIRRSKQFAASQGKKDDELIKKTVEFATLVKNLLPEHFPGAEKNDQAARLESLKPRIARRLTAIDKHKEELQLQMDQLAEGFRQVNEAFKQLKLHQDELTDLLGREGLDNRTF
ncbi:hypothetical protein KJ359_003476 [Pestalotiopsis sp. 9143b]|nr:hypothetical protein KJ359_003476 [Pestalotiopsis sp. 9143b]